METDRIKRLLDPEYQRQTALRTLGLIAKFWGPEAASKEAEGYSLPTEDIEAAINAGIQEAEGLSGRLDNIRVLAEDPNDSLLQES